MLVQLFFKYLERRHALTLGHAANINYMNTTILEHFSQIRHHETNPTYKESARTFIYEEFRRFGLDTEISNFTTDNVNGSNIIGILKGKRFGTPKDMIVGIGAHYDTVYNSPDNLKGSKYFVNTWLPQFIASKYNSSSRYWRNLYGFYILDTIMNYNNSAGSQKLPSGLTNVTIERFFPNVYTSLNADNFQGNYIHSVYGINTYHSLNPSLSMAWEYLPAPKYKMERFPLDFTDVDILISLGFSDIVRSDHASFWSKAYPALYLTDSGNYRGVMTNCYHEPCDSAEVMLTEDNLMFMGKQADALYYSLHYLAVTDCGIPPDIENTTYTITNDSLTAVYRCTENKVVVPSTSDATLTCMPTGNWSNISFVCDDSFSISGKESLRTFSGQPILLVFLVTLLSLISV
ncbi:hypothetical protein ACJMK2_024341 [Sinanodonta woodiana]|uniref:Sushi domain-containing protein n=1 Tax=Sinanodonta woodiana TaxID=1069815 RepID=A0ABD3T736_SINWO